MPKKETAVMGAIRHNERCRDCKESIKNLLAAIFHDVEVSYDINLPAKLEDYSGTNIYDDIAPVYQALQNHKGYHEFLKAKRLPRVDFFIPDKKLIIEFDESQHFTKLRQIALSLYPDRQEFGFPVDRWRMLCQDLSKRDNDPLYRDEQRAWYDTLRDFAPFLWKTGKTVRLFSRDFVWCPLNSKDGSDLRTFREIISNHGKVFLP
jgi:hypothetical protein